jgi:predicted transcriptional regulator
MNQKNLKPKSENNFLQDIFEEMVKTKSEDVKIVKESVSKPITKKQSPKTEDLNEEVSHKKTFNEITNDVLVQEGWLGRFAANAIGRGAELGANIKNRSDQKSAEKANKANFKSAQDAYTKGGEFNLPPAQKANVANAGHAKIQAIVQRIYENKIADAFKDMVKLGLISGTNISKLDHTVREILSTTITNVLQSEKKLAEDETLVIKNAKGDTFITKNTPEPENTPNVNKPANTPSKQANVPNANRPNLGGKPVTSKVTNIPKNQWNSANRPKTP